MWCAPGEGMCDPVPGQQYCSRRQKKAFGKLMDQSTSLSGISLHIINQSPTIAAGPAPCSGVAETGSRIRFPPSGNGIASSCAEPTEESPQGIWDASDKGNWECPVADSAPANKGGGEEGGVIQFGAAGGGKAWEAEGPVWGIPDAQAKATRGA